MVDTSFDTIKTEFLMTEHGDDYIDSDKNILLKTPSTICNYYEKSEIYSEKKTKIKIRIKIMINRKYQNLKSCPRTNQFRYLKIK